MKKAEFSDLKGLKVDLNFRLSIGLLNACKTMYFDRNIDLSEKIRMAKKSEDNYLSSALNKEFYFSDFAIEKFKKILFSTFRFGFIFKKS